MEYIWGALAGALYGVAIGALKYIFLWNAILHPKDERKVTGKAIYSRMMISYAVNVVALIAVLLLRNLLPFNFAATAIAAAIGLSVAGKFASAARVVEKIETPG